MKGMKNNVLLIGAGAVASVVSKHLAADKGVGEILCGSIDIKRAREFINSGNRKIKLMSLDASRKQQVAKAAKDVDIIINASLPNFNENIMEAALKVGADYQDLCSLLVDCKTPEQLKFHKRFKKEKIVGLINTGVSPGITNLLAKEAANKFDRVSEIKIRLVEEQKTSELIFAWSPTVTLDELTAPPLIYKNGRFRFVKPFEGNELCRFPAPFGKTETVSIYGDEVSTIPKFIKTKKVDYKSGGTDIELAKALYRLGLFNKKPVLLHGKKIVPIEFFSKIAPRVPSPKEMVKLFKDRVVKNASLMLSVEVVGTREGKKLKNRNLATFPDLKKILKIMPGATYISYPTGVSAAAFFKIIPGLDSYGVFPPEALDENSRRNILIELESNGAKIEEIFQKA